MAYCFRSFDLLFLFPLPVAVRKENKFIKDVIIINRLQLDLLFKLKHTPGQVVCPVLYEYMMYTEYFS